MAIKLPDVYGPGRDQDLLLTSSIDRPLLRRLLFPARSLVWGAFSTALPYDFGSARVVLLLVPARTSDGRSTDGDGDRAAGGALAELRVAAANGLGSSSGPPDPSLPTAGHRDGRPAAPG